MPFIAVTEKAFSHLVNEQYAVLQRALSAHERLERIVLSERGLDGVAGALASLIGGPALIFDARGERARPPRAPRARSTRARSTRCAPSCASAPATARAAATRRGGELAGRALALPVARTPPDGAAATGRRARRRGWSRPRTAAPLTEFDRLTLHQAVTIVALELLRRRVADDTERRLAGDVLTALVSRRARRRRARAPARAVRARATAPACSCSRRRGALQAPPPRRRSPRAVRDEARRRARRRHRRASRARCCRRARRRRGAVRARRAPARARRARDRRPTLAGGRRPRGRRRASCGARSTRRAARSRRAALAGDGPNGDAGRPRLATYRDLGSFQLLLSLQDDDALRLFCDSILAPIEECEGAYGGELMRSLEAFIECNGQWERAARQLYCHRHTLRYRIRRVEELTGRSLDSARDRIDFWLALRGRELIHLNERIVR